VLGDVVSKQATLFPVYEMRPIDEYGTEWRRYAGGLWIADDGEWDIAFISSGYGAPIALGITLPYQRNILWKRLDGHWTGHEERHPRGNPWHYMLRPGETEWGGGWKGRDSHENRRVHNAAMSKLCAEKSCANGRGPEFVIGDPFIAAGALRERDTGMVVEFPEKFVCMYCGPLS
jgi:hypothetical protein